MNLRKNSFQMTPFINTLRHHTTSHDGIDMVFDTAQPFDGLGTHAFPPAQQQSHQEPPSHVALGHEQPHLEV